MIGERVDPHAWITPDIKFESRLFFTDNITSQKALLFPVKRHSRINTFLDDSPTLDGQLYIDIKLSQQKQADVQVNLLNR